MRMRYNESGFTLIEIIVVLIIVGVLAAIALPNLFSNVEKSRSSEAIQVIGSMKRAVDTCMTLASGAAGNPPYSANCTAQAVATGQTINPWVVGPTWNYAIAETTAGASYTITATRANGTGTLTLVGGAPSVAVVKTGTQVYAGAW